MSDFHIGEPAQSQPREGTRVIGICRNPHEPFFWDAERVGEPCPNSCHRFDDEPCDDRHEFYVAAQPEQPREEEARVNPFNDTTGEGSPLTADLFRRTVDQVGNLDARREAAPPRGEEARAYERELDRINAELRRGVPVDDLLGPAPDQGERDGLAERLARESTHPEQSGQVEAERIVGAALDLLDSLGAPHYHDLIGMTYTLRKEQADNLRAALEPAQSQPREGTRVDLAARLEAAISGAIDGYVAPDLLREAASALRASAEGEMRGHPGEEV